MGLPVCFWEETRKHAIVCGEMGLFGTLLGRIVEALLGKICGENGIAGILPGWKRWTVGNVACWDALGAGNFGR